MRWYLWVGLAVAAYLAYSNRDVLTAQYKKLTGGA